MKWIKYQIVQSTNGKDSILVNKKVGYSEANLAIAQKEAYNGCEIIEDSESFEKEPLTVDFDLILTENVNYGTELPAAGIKGRLFFKVVE